VRIVPAVDIRGGRCVNLVQGDYAKETVFSDDPVAQVRLWQELGAEIVHIVDLDGAKEGRPCAIDALRAVGDAGIRFQVGGGIRDMSALDLMIELGAARVIVGTAAVQRPDFLREAVATYSDRIAVAIDGKGGRVAVSAWDQVTSVDAVLFARQVADVGATRIIYTDVLSDGMMRGPNIEATRAVAMAVTIPVTASGGMSSLDDVRAIRSLAPLGVDEVIVGRALYLNAFSLQDAIAAAGAAL
jgi:phosphoribosylformimino-5-aminoimidazole carboxamide ribotide isomerase